MANFTNAQKLAAVLNHWSAPLIQGVIMNNISAIPFLGNLEQRVKASGWVSPNWSMAAELKPLMVNMSSVIIEPILTRYISGIPDESIPTVAHTIVDNAIKNGGIELMEGKVIFDRNDLEELKRYLEYNLPIEGKSCYEVIVEHKTETT